MPAPLYATGKAGGFTLGSTSAYFSKWNFDLTKEYAPATDSSGFDPSNQQLWKKQAAGSIQGTGSIEGFFDLSVSSSAFLTTVLGDVAVAAIFKYTQTLNFASGLINLTNFKTGVEVEGGTTIGFTCDYMTYGPMSFFV